MVIALGRNRRDRSSKSPDGKKVLNFPIFHANAVLEIHKKIQCTQDSINTDENDSLKNLFCTKFINFMAQKFTVQQLFYFFYMHFIYYYFIIYHHHHY